MCSGERRGCSHPSTVSMRWNENRIRPMNGVLISVENQLDSISMRCLLLHSCMDPESRYCADAGSGLLEPNLRPNWKWMANCFFRPFAASSLLTNLIAIELQWPTKPIFNLSPQSAHSSHCAPSETFPVMEWKMYFRPKSKAVNRLSWVAKWKFSLALNRYRCIRLAWCVPLKRFNEHCVMHGKWLHVYLHGCRHAQSQVANNDKCWNYIASTTRNDWLFISVQKECEATSHWAVTGCDGTLKQQRGNHIAGTPSSDNFYNILNKCRRIRCIDKCYECIRVCECGSDITIRLL